MILRKPYALLIKYFKFFHLLLVFLMYLFSLKCKNIFNWFNEYINSNRLKQVDDLISTYIPISIFIYLFLIITICCVIIIILRKKQKPLRYYFVTIIFYLLELVGIVFIIYVFKNIEEGIINIRVIYLARDFSQLIYYLIIPFGLISLIRGVGFNVKQFNFKKDLQELAIESSDNEEVEVDVAVDVDDLKTSFKRFLRKFKYVYLDNKIFFISLCLVITFGVVVSIYYYIFVTNKVYKENERFLTNSFEVTVLDSYQVSTDSLGNDLGEYIYTIVKLKIKNKDNTEIVFPYQNTKISVNNNVSFRAKLDLYDNFPEFGIGYNSEPLLPGETKYYTFIYEIDEKYKDNHKQYQYLLSYTQDGNELKFNYAKVDLNLEDFNNHNEYVNTVSLGKELLFSNSLINGAKIIIDDLDFNNRYIYKTTSIINGKVVTINKYIVASSSGFSKTIMRLKVNFVSGEGNSELLNEDFISKFGTIRYIINDKEYSSKYILNNKTPETNTGYVYYEVKEEIKNANKIYLDFVIRGKVYTYILRDE